MNYGFIIDNRKCIGCHACTVACKAEHNVPLGVNRTWVKYIEKGTYPHTRRLFAVHRCNHCADAPCVEICPVTALYSRPDGIVDFNNDRCIGCKACTQACPYDALYIDPDTHTAAKCNYCSHRVEVGIEPACVIVCPEHAIISGDMDDPGTEIAQLLAHEQVQVRKPEKNTRPKLFYIEGDEVVLTPALAPQNSDYMWSSQSRPVGHGRKGLNEPLEQHAADGNLLHTLLEKPEALFSSPEPAQHRRPLTTLLESARRVYDPPSEGVMWGWEVPAYIWTKAVAAGTVLVPFLAKSFGLSSPTSPTSWVGALLGLLFVALTGALLVLDLDRPDRFLSVLLRPQWRSWLVRGAYIITSYTVLLGFWLVGELGELRTLQSALHWPLIGLAFFTAIYTAFLFAQAKGRDFWQSPGLVLHMLGHAFVAGSALLFLLSFPLPALIDDRLLFARVLFGGLIFSLAVLAFELTISHPTADAHRTAHMITRGPFARLFWGGVVGVGLILPLILLASSSLLLIAVAALLSLAGLFLTEHIWVRAPQLIPLS
ncbi:MAG: polysulfide reductase NrfD [Deltaproteobacteria bacterium]|nr:polysulfide reductase NrfD [Deltaproteobacteria bacterium]